MEISGGIRKSTRAQLYGGEIDGMCKGWTDYQENVGGRYGKGIHEDNKGTWSMTVNYSITEGKEKDVI